MADTTIDRPADNRVAVPTGEPSKGRIAVLTADKVEDVEFFYPYYRFTEAGYGVDVITPSGGVLTGNRGMGIQETVALADVDPADYLMLLCRVGSPRLSCATTLPRSTSCAPSRQPTCLSGWCVMDRRCSSRRAWPGAAA